MREERNRQDELHNHKHEQAKCMFAYDDTTGHMSLNDGNHRINSSIELHAEVDGDEFLLNRYTHTHTHTHTHKHTHKHKHKHTHKQKHAHK